eukprot:TRINITY_DN21270_c1_g7_i1.p1 TRINITY_DN21270_c1_g7~~TRINITY_DN21270_c1_g7_i1.p1  ORF type:complete len:568 (+),score=63.85 TRINITY_DN21270_c1_g7_i1:131-1834(+)
MDAASSDHVRRVNREDLRTSLADLHEICGCAFAVVSTSEFGHDPTWEFPESVTSHRGLGSQRPYTAPTMKILQDLPASLRSDVSFSNLVDFKGSSSAEFCSSRIRCVMDGLVIRCDRDFDRDLRSAFKDEEPPEEGWTEDALREQAILHSAWMIFWRGKVFGGLTAMLATMQSHATPPVNMQADRHVNFINPKLCAKARVIVAISIDGGKITEVEKNVLPKLILDVLSDIRRRQYTWATNTWIIWAQFQNPVQLLKSMNGERNLRPDMRERYQFAMDQTWTPFTYVAVDDTEEKKQLLAKDRIPRPMSLLDRERQMSVESVMQSSLLDTTAANSLVSACMNFPDKSAVDFLLDRHPELTNERECFSKDGNSPLSIACFKGHVDIVTSLLERKALPEHPKFNLFASASYAKRGGEIVRLLVLARADQSQREEALVGPDGLNSRLEILTEACESLKNNDFRSAQLAFEKLKPDDCSRKYCQAMDFLEERIKAAKKCQNWLMASVRKIEAKQEIENSEVLQQMYNVIPQRASKDGSIVLKPGQTFSAKRGKKQLTTTFTESSSSSDDDAY